MYFGYTTRRKITSIGNIVRGHNQTSGDERKKLKKKKKKKSQTKEKASRNQILPQEYQRDKHLR